MFWETKVGDKTVISPKVGRTHKFYEIRNAKRLNKLTKKKIRFQIEDDNYLKVYRDKPSINISGGSYVLKSGGYPYPEEYLVKVETREEKIFNLDIYNEVEDYIQNFLKSKDVYDEKELFYKCGLFLYGPPGNSKTTFIRQFIKTTIPKDAIVMWCDHIPSIYLLRKLKKTNKLLVFIFEEITSSISNSSAVKRFLEFCDGENTPNNSIFIATTNYPESMPGNIINRRGRFDKVIKFDNPDSANRKSIILNYMDTCEEEWVEETEGFSFADIKECYLQKLIHGFTFGEAVKDLKRHKLFVKNNFREQHKIGI